MTARLSDGLTTPLAVLYVTLWASAYVPSKIGATAIPPMWFLVARFLVAGLVMAAIAVALRRPFPTQPSQWLAYAALGVLANAAYLGFTYTALSRGLAAGIGSIVASTNPLILAVLAPRLLGESLTWRKGVGLALGFGGVVGVMLARTGSTSARPSDVGLALIGVTANVASTILFKRAQGSTDLLAINTIQLLAAGLALVLPAVVLEASPRIEITSPVVISFVYLVGVLSVGASVLWFWLLSRGAASRVSAFYFLTPIFGLAFGAVLLGEAVRPGDAVGLVAVALGIVLVQRG
ncbi:MAG: DMT family transporter [Chloroflexota bacterium]|nr:DMT family transporter [Chloroflexota bacterium]